MVCAWSHSYIQATLYCRASPQCQKLCSLNSSVRATGFSKVRKDYLQHGITWNKLFWNVERFNHAHCSTPHVAALTLPALMAPLAHTLASFPGPDQLFIICSVKLQCKGCGVLTWWRRPGVTMDSHNYIPHSLTLLLSGIQCFSSSTLYTTWSGVYADSGVVLFFFLIMSSSWYSVYTNTSRDCGLRYSVSCLALRHLAIKHHEQLSRFRPMWYRLTPVPARYCGAHVRALHAR